LHTIIIDTDDAYAKIQELAAREGKSVATVVIEAIDEKLERDQATPDPEGLAARLIAIGKRTAPLWHDDTPHGELLYDENGLPK
jgi:hypothetical protein